MGNKLVLADTSIWVEYFRHGRSKEAQILDDLISTGLIATCSPIKAEIISGAQSRPDFQKLKEFLGAVLFLEAPGNIWSQIEERRFLLARKGVQASLIDLWIAVIAYENNALIWTLDKDFFQINKVIHVEFFNP